MLHIAQVLKLLRERRGEPGEPLDEMPDGQVIPLDMARAYCFHVVYAANVPPVGRNNFRRRIAAHLFGIAVVILDDLAVSSIAAECVLDRRT
jgi:hypothetical protein